MSLFNANKISTSIVTYFGIGYLKPAPGTWGTLFTIPLWYFLSQLGPVVYMAVTFLLIVVAIAACEIYEKHIEGHDHSHVVIDEVVGYLITMTWLPFTWQACVLGFFLFRILDIAKPFPIGYLDKKVGGGFGVVVDDLVAGAIANIVLQLVYTNTSWLGSQIMVISQ